MEVFNTNGPNMFVQNDDAAHNSSKRQVIDYKYEAGHEKKSTNHISTAQMDVPHTHGVTCRWCCWAAAS